MPTIRYYDALSSKVITQEFDSATFRLHKMTPDTMTYTDADGASIEMVGTDFKYTKFGEVRHGTISAITLRDSDGHILQTIKNIDPGHPASGSDPADPGDAAADAVGVYDYFKNYGSSALAFVFNGDGDTLVGSNKNDILDGGDKGDIITGGKGNDILSGSGGTDHLTGGGGRDTFFFKPNSGRDIVTDFDDQGKDQDTIMITAGQWGRLEMHQHGNEVVLDFGWGEQMIIEHAVKADIGKDDFTIL